MKTRQILMSMILASLSLISQPALAYIGPGAGLGMIGSLLAVIVAIVLALVGVIVYPFRLLRKKRQQAKDRRNQSAG